MTREYMVPDVTRLNRRQPDEVLIQLTLLAAEVVQLKRFALALAERVAAQSELLSKRAERCDHAP